MDLQRFLKELTIFTQTPLLKLFMLGLTSLAAQVVLIQEFLGIVSGNEFTVSVFFTLWMLFTAAGAWVHSLFKPRKNGSTTLYVILSVLPVGVLFSMQYFKNILFEPGISLNPWQIIWYSGIHIFPFCFVSGYLFVAFSGEFSKSNKTNVMAYPLAVESIGSMVGLLVFALVLPYFLNPLATFTVLFIVNGIYISLNRITIFQKIGFLTGFAGIAFIIYLLPLQQLSFKSLYPNQRLEFYQPSPHGNLMLTSMNGQKNLYENGQLLYYSNNETDREETVHFAMAQRPRAKNVLLVSGGLNGMLAEIEKYSPTSIDYLEINKIAIEKLRNEIPGIHHPLANIISNDPISYLQQSKKKYNLIVMATPDPANMKLNRFYTFEFVEKIKKSLTPDGVCIFHFCIFPGYLEKTDIELVSGLFNNLSKHFKNVKLIPTEKIYFLASDKTLSIHICDTLAKYKIQTSFINSAYYDTNLVNQKTNQILENIVNIKPINSNLYPLSYGLYLEKWFHQNNFSPLWFIIPSILLLLASIYIIISSPRSLAPMFSMGFSTSAMQIVLLFLLQSFLGILHHSIAIVSVIYMAGLATGSIIKIHKKSILSENKFTHFAFFVLAGCVFASSYWFNQFVVSPFLIYFILCSFCFGFAFLAGRQYQFSVNYFKNNISKATSKTYSVDLFGAAIGGFVVPVFVVPATGIPFCIACIAALNLFIALLLKKNKK